MIFLALIIFLNNSIISFNFSSLFSIIITPFIRDVIILIMFDLMIQKKRKGLRKINNISDVEKYLDTRIIKLESNKKSTPKSAKKKTYENLYLVFIIAQEC